MGSSKNLLFSTFVCIFFYLLGRSFEIFLVHSSEKIETKSFEKLSSNKILFTKPGLYFSNKLFLWGARITSSYEHDQIFLDFFAQSTHNLELIKHTYNPPLNMTLISLKDTFSFKLWCVVEKSVSKCRSEPISNLDENARYSHYRFRCSLPRFYKKNNVSHLAVEVRSRNDGSVIFNINRHTDSVGIMGPENELKLDFRDQKLVDITLCIGGISAIGVRYLPEFIQHHIRMGVDRFIIGIHNSRFLLDLNETYAGVRNVTLPLIDAGIVFLLPMETPLEIYDIERDILKMLFYDACLFHAKGSSKYVANWDVDEYWMPVNRSLPTLKHVLEVFNQNDICPEWCYLSFPSHSIWQIPDQQIPLPEIATISDTFKIRQNKPPDYVWQKSIAKTRNAMSSGCKFKNYSGKKLY